MNLSHYIWIFALAEALAVSLILVAVLGFKWLRLRRERKEFARASEKISALFAGEIAKAKDRPARRPALQSTRLAYLTALSLPFKKRQVSDEQAWQNVLDTLARSFDELEKTTSNGFKTGTALKQGETDMRETPPASSVEQVEELTAPTLDTDIENLISGFRRRQSALDADWKTTEDLTVDYERLQRAHENLHSKLDSDSQLDSDGQLLREIDDAKRHSQEFMQAATKLKRNFNILTQEYEGQEEHIEELHTAIKHYRQSVHHLVIDRDGLAAEKKELMDQLQTKEKRIEKLKRDITLLRHEYNQLYGVTQ